MKIYQKENGNYVVVQPFGSGEEKVQFEINEDGLRKNSDYSNEQLAQMEEAFIDVSAIGAFYNAINSDTPSKDVLKFTLGLIQKQL